MIDSEAWPSALASAACGAPSKMCALGMCAEEWAGKMEKMDGCFVEILIGHGNYLFLSIPTFFFVDQQVASLTSWSTNDGLLEGMPMVIANDSTRSMMRRPCLLSSKKCRN